MPEPGEGGAAGHCHGGYRCSTMGCGGDASLGGMTAVGRSRPWWQAVGSRGKERATARYKST
jgi:hypothetical protein